MTIDRTALDLIFPPEERGDWRKEKLNYRRDMVSKVAKAIDEPEEFVLGCKDGWAFGGARFRAQLQWAALKEFGLYDAEVGHLDDADYTVAHRKFCRQTYNDSQKFLADLGITELTVVRTMPVSRIIAESAGLRQMERWRVGTVFNLQPLSSFTLQPEMVLDRWGQQFGFMPYEDQVLVSVRATIPAEKVWSVPGPGIGAKIDFEVIVFGGQFKCAAIVHERRPRPAAEIW